MTTESVNTNEQDVDADDLLLSMEITRIERRTCAGGAWVTGKMAGHRFDALVFPEHAVNPDYEIEDSRISKLWVQRIDDRATVYNWDRGADIEPTTPVAGQIVDLLAAGLAEFIYGE